MNKISIILAFLLSVIILNSCSKSGDCKCVTTSIENGVITGSSTNTRSLSTGIPGPFGTAVEEDCDSGDSYSSNTYSGSTSSYEVECELE